jgi:hypothetical protein
MLSVKLILFSNLFERCLLYVVSSFPFTLARPHLFLDLQAWSHDNVVFAMRSITESDSPLSCWCRSCLSRLRHEVRYRTGKCPARHEEVTQ